MSTTDPQLTAVRMFLRAIDEQDWSVLEALLHPQAEYEVSGYLPFRDREAILNYYKNIRQIRDGEHIIEAVMSDGDRAVCLGRFQGTTLDGVEVGLLFADALQFQDRKIKKRRVYYCEPKTTA